MWSHFVNLLLTSWQSVLAALSTSTLSIVLFSLTAPVVTLVITLGVVSKLNAEKTFVEHLKQSVVPTLIGFAVPIVFLACVFMWKIGSTVYADHRDMAGRWQNVVREKDNLKVQLKERDDYIARLLGSTLTPAKYPQPTRIPAVQMPEKIHNASATVRVTCTLTNPSKTPGTTATIMTDAPSYLAGGTGRAFLQTNSASYQRTEEGAVVITENYAVNSPSDLLEQPVSALANYKSFHLEIPGVSRGTFDTCIFLELTFRINGRDVFQTAGEIRKKVPKGLAINAPYKYDKVAVAGTQ